MNSRPRISIITPTYNHQAFIADCIDSVLAQTYPHWEQIIIDDGSTDRTAEIVASYAARDQRIELIRQENRGIWQLAETYNIALEHSSGELIAILEGDDFWPKCKLADQVKNHQANVILSYGVASIVNKDDTTTRYHSPPFEGKVNNIQFLKMLLLRQSSILPATTVIRRDALCSIDGFKQDNFPAVDFPTFVRLAESGGQFLFIPQVLGYWRQHQGQVTHQHGIYLIEGRLRISLERYDSLPTRTVEQLGLKREAIVEAHRAGLADSYLAAVRNALLQKDHASLRQFIPKLWKYGNLKRKIQALCATLAATIDADIEWIFHTVEKVSTKGQS